MGLDITPLVPAGRQAIESYGDGGFVIAGARHAGSMLVWPDRAVSWNVSAIADIGEDSLAPLFAAPMPEILIVGCGPRFQPAPGALRATVRGRGAALEWMDTGAACRTFNVLLAEGRPVVAALIAVP